MEVEHRSVNLLEDHLEPLSQWEKIYIWIHQTAKYLLIIAEVALILTFVLHLFYDQQIARLKERIEKEVAVLERNKRQESYVVILDKSLRQLDWIHKNQVDTASRHKYVYSLIPAGINLASLQLNFNTLSIAGTSSSYDNIKVLFDNFNKASKINKDSIVTSTSQLQQGNIYFTLTCEFKNE